jgi:hypothetical protein
VVLLLAGCTDSSPTAGPVIPATPSATTSASPLACAAIEVRDVEAVPGEWALAEYVQVRGPEGTRFTATLPADAPADIAMGDLVQSGTSQTRTEGLTVREATVSTDPASDVDPATLLAAIGQAFGDPLSLTNTGQAGFTGELTAELGEDGAVVFRGAQETTVTFAGDCSRGSEGPTPVTGAARYFTRGEAGVLDCSEPAGPGTLAAVAAEFCTID